MWILFYENFTSYRQEAASIHKETTESFGGGKSTQCFQNHNLENFKKKWIFISMNEWQQIYSMRDSRSANLQMQIFEGYKRSKRHWDDHNLS